MRFVRTEREELVDDLLTLALLYMAAPEGPVGDRMEQLDLAPPPGHARRRAIVHTGGRYLSDWKGHGGGCQCHQYELHLRFP